MSKRVREEDALDDAPASKRVRSFLVDRFSKLSDELILRVLSNLPISQLVVCQRLSHKHNILAGDSQLWKSLYYNRFVRPRASRLPGLRDLDKTSESLHFASKASKWLDDEYLLKRGGRTNWKWQYKLRQNWSKGSCAVNEIQVAEQAPVPPVLVQLHGGVIYIADQTDGLRAWSAKDERKMIARSPFADAGHGPPTALALDVEDRTSDRSRVIVGFENGAFALYTLGGGEDHFTHQYTHEPSSNGVLSAVSLNYPYAAAMTATQVLSLYQFQQGDGSKPPRLLHSLKSSSVWPPLSTSLRLIDSCISISIAYALPTYLSGWTVGIQEIKVDKSGRLLDSRLASAIDQHYRPLAFSLPPMMFHLPTPAAGSLATSTTMELRHVHSKPTSLSYTHPYLLVSHPDNTLTLYLVTSTDESLSISAGSRLWGHTSSVSGAHVGGRGKAVSISRRGDELRVWELEGGFASAAAKRRLTSGDLSVQVRPEKRSTAETSQAGIDLVSNGSPERTPVSGDTSEDAPCELTLTRGWIGFDEENVVVLKEQSQGRQALVVYDFT